MFRLEIKLFAVALVSIILVECASLIGHIFPVVEDMLYFIIVIATLGLSIWRLEYGWWIALSELVIGSFGYLFSFEFGIAHISVRLGIFLVVCIAWLIRAIRKKRLIISHAWFFMPLLAWIGIIGVGILIGVLRQNGLSSVFFDANGYLYLGLFPVAVATINSWKRIHQTITVVIAGVVAVSVKTLATLFYFAHVTDTHFIRIIYTWIRDTRVGEISPVVSGYYRIFFQGHIWVVAVSIGVIVVLLIHQRKNFTRSAYLRLWALMTVSGAVIIVSFSRSLWLAFGSAGLLLCVWLVASRIITVRRLGIAGVTAVVAVMVQLILISGLVNIPLPGGGGSGVSTSSLVSERLTNTDEAAVGTRFQLLPPLINAAFQHPLIGSGFGTTVTYQSLDPRTSEINGGLYTTYSFEWGYLDIMTEMGLAGLLIILYFFWIVLRKGVILLRQAHSPGEQQLIITLLFVLLMLLVVHFTTPYINHPLGIGILMLAAAMLYAIQREGEYHPIDSRD